MCHHQGFTDIHGLKFEANLGIVDAPIKIGEYWIYVSPGERRIRILKEGYIPLQYDIPVTIESSMVYNMVIKGSENTDLQSPKFSSGMLLFKTEPSGAELWLNNDYYGITTISRELEVATYNFRVQKKNFHTKEGSFQILPGETTIQSFQLQPSFGSATIESSPEPGATIELDGNQLSQITPCKIDTLSSGTHAVKVKKEFYEPLQKDFTLKDEEKLKLMLELKPLFGNLEITTLPGLAIFIDGNTVGTGSFTGRLIKGIHTIEVKDEKYYPESQKYSMEVGKNDKLQILPKPRTGSLSIITEPPEALILLNGDDKGRTPRIITNLLIGNYNVELQKEGYAKITKRIEIKENEKYSVSEKFNNLFNVSFSSKPSGADLYLNSDKKGSTPLSLMLPLGSYYLELNKKGFNSVEEHINVNDYSTDFKYNLYEPAGKSEIRKAKTTAWVLTSIAIASFIGGEATDPMLEHGTGLVLVSTCLISEIWAITRFNKVSKLKTQYGYK